MALGENLRRLRKEKGWTQHELAERAGIKLTHISTLEKVESDPKLSTIIKLIGALECSPNDLLATDGPKGLAAGLRVAIEKAMRLPSQDKTLLLQVSLLIMKRSLASLTNADLRFIWKDFDFNHADFLAEKCTRLSLKAQKGMPTGAASRTRTRGTTLLRSITSLRRLMSMPSSLSSLRCR